MSSGANVRKRPAGSENKEHSEPGLVAGETDAAPGGSPLRVRHFRNLWAGATISSFGDQFYFVALPWLVLQVTNSSWALGTIMMTAAIPRSVLMLVGGAVNYYISPRKIMISSALLRTFMVATAGLLIWTNAMRPVHLYILAALFGISDAFAIPAAQAIIPSLVGQAQLPAANALLQGSLRITNMTGPAPAGWVIKSWGAAWAMFIDAFSFLFIVIALVKVPEAPPQPRTTSSILSAIGAGLAYVWHDPAMRAFMLLLAVLNFCLTGPISIGLAILARTHFASAAVYGMWMSVFSAGALAGTAIAGSVRRRRGNLLAGIAAVMGFSVCGIALFRLHPAVLAVIMVAIGAGIGLVNTALVAWFQQRVESRFLSRVSSVMTFCATGLLPISMLLTGAIAQSNLMALFFVSGFSILAIAMLAAASAGVRAID